MNQKRSTLIFCTIALAAVTFVFATQGKVASPKTKTDKIPPHVVYRHVFHHIVLLKEKANEKDREGEKEKAASMRAFYKTQTNLSELQGQMLDEIAAECDREVAQQDAAAQKVIAAAREQHPGGKLEVGESPLPPPDLLKVMQEERDAIILRARDRLQATLGLDAFARFDEYVQRNIADKVQPVAFKPERPVLPASPRMQARPANPKQ